MNTQIMVLMIVNNQMKNFLSTIIKKNKLLKMLTKSMTQIQMKHKINNKATKSLNKINSTIVNKKFMNPIHKIINI